MKNNVCVNPNKIEGVPNQENSDTLQRETETIKINETSYETVYIYIGKNKVKNNSDLIQKKVGK